MLSLTYMKDCTMCERKKRCEGCKRVLPITDFGTHKVVDGSDRPDSYCKKCRYVRDSKKAFKKKKVIEAYISTVMFNMTGRDY